MKNIIFIKASFCTILNAMLLSCGKDKTTSASEHSAGINDTLVKTDSATVSKDEVTEKVRNAITTKYLEPEDIKLLDSTDRKFSYEKVDLNNDGKQEIFVSFFTPYFCGTGGCSLVLLDADCNIINRFTVTETPLYVSPQQKNGWRVICVNSKGQWKDLENKDGKYPSNPSVAKNSSAEPDAKSTVLFQDQNQKKYNF